MTKYVTCISLESMPFSISLTRRDFLNILLSRAVISVVFMFVIFYLYAVKRLKW